MPGSHADQPSLVDLHTDLKGRGREALSRSIDSVRTALASKNRVRGRTHEFYRYPARFPPEFAREAIHAFTRPGDVVLDPFMGGGTSAVEAVCLGRRYIGVDVNPISTFLAKVKTTPLTLRDASVLLGWAETPRPTRDGKRPRGPVGNRTPLGPNVPWWIALEVQRLLDTAAELPVERQSRFARCTILRSAQWALDNRKNLATTDEFRAVHLRFVAEMLASAVRTRQAGQAEDGSNLGIGQRFLCRQASGMELDHRVPAGWKPVKLVVTSPPYPGVHVLYHRWQVQGRRETAAPFWIVGEEDGHPASYYTMGPRYASDLSTYLMELEESFRSIAAMLDRNSIVVQLIGFSDPATQLGPYLDVMEAAGLKEIDVGMGGPLKNRLWRQVPNRRWYALPQPAIASEREVMLIHRLAA